MAHTNSKNLSIGLTTAFEQTIFEPYLKLWESYFGYCRKIVSKESPSLIKDVLKGKLTAAFVAFPVEAHGLFKLEIGYSEKLLALIPANWKEAEDNSLSLAQLMKSLCSGFSGNVTKHILIIWTRFLPNINLTCIYRRA